MMGSLRCDPSRNVTVSTPVELTIYSLQKTYPFIKVLLVSVPLRSQLYHLPMEVLRGCQGRRQNEKLFVRCSLTTFYFFSPGYSCAKKWETLPPTRGPFKSYQEVSVQGKNGSKPVDPQILMDKCKDISGHSIMFSFEKARYFKSGNKI